ncbi:MAG: hypothetical protein ACREOU_04385 [Candidatus Eiseniibacteriota bacterium]
MKVTRILASLLFLAAAASTASAVPAVRMSWDNCTPLVVNKDVAPGTIAGLYGSVVGQELPHQGYEVWLLLGGGGPIADAWRFDSDGCQTPAGIALDHTAPTAVSKTCPSFQGLLASVQVKTYDYDPSTGKARAVVANAYPAGILNPVLTQRYFLMRANFDHTFSVNGPTNPGVDCGGLERGVCVHVTRANWLDLAGITIPFALENEFVTARDPANDTRCPGATPVETKTWGQIKDAYRN